MKIKIETNTNLFYFKLKKINGVTINGYVYPKHEDMQNIWDKVIGYTQDKDKDEFFDKKCYTSIYDKNDMNNLPVDGYIIFDLDEEEVFYFKLKYGDYIL